MSHLALLNDRTDQVIVSQLTVADTFFSRFCGLQFKRELAVGSGLLLVPCGSVHTCWMRFPVDVFFISDSAHVVHVRRNVRPWRVAICRAPSHAVLEVASGAIDLESEDEIRLQANGCEVPLSLDFFPLAQH